VADDPESTSEGDIQMDYSSDQLCSPSIGEVTENYMQEIRSVSLVFDNLEYFTIWCLSISVSVELKKSYCMLCIDWEGLEERTINTQ
jgi:hypothetical protein